MALAMSLSLSRRRTSVSQTCGNAGLFCVEVVWLKLSLRTTVRGEDEWNKEQGSYVVDHELLKKQNC